MAKLNITQAAREWNIARSTLQRAVKRGDVAVTTGENGVKTIDSSEMVRAYGAANGRSAVNLGTPSVTTNIEVEYLKKQVTVLERMIKLQETNLTEKERVIENQREMLTAFFKRLNPPKKTK